MLFRRLILITIFITIVLLANVDYNEGSLSSTEGNLPPDIPTLIRIFDNAIINTYNTSYECTVSIMSTDPDGDSIKYRVQWDTNPLFIIDDDPPISNEISFYGSGDTAITTIPAHEETIYYWRACAKEKVGPSKWTDWSEARSFTMDMDIEDNFPYWYQVTGAQFEQDTMNNVKVVGDAVKLVSTLTLGTLTSLLIVYDNLKTEDSDRNDWGGVKWTKSSDGEDIKIQIEWLNGGSWELVTIPGNPTSLSCGAAFCSVDLSSMDGTTYDTLRIKALFQSSKSPGDPALLMWALGKLGGITGVSETEEPLVFALNKIEPNPFVNSTNIQYQIPKRVKVNLQVYDIVGRSVVTLVNSVQKAGYYSINWRGTNRNDVPLPSGVYFLRMEAGEFMATQKMLLLQ
ncbi:hypothetical protein ES703_85246 [subsurface metagenome]